MRADGWFVRAVRLAGRLIIGTVSLIVVVAAVGYLFVMGRVDPEAAWAYARRELQSGFLDGGERVMRVARVYQRRPANYFRAAYGLLVATPDRVLFIGVEPRDNLAGADAPASILTSEFPDDTLLGATMRRIYSFTAHGVTLTRLGRTESYAASHGHEAELDSLTAYIASQQRYERAAAAQDRALREQLAQLLRQPLHYVVQRGDALSTIAGRYGATAAQLRQWNNLAGDRVRVGDTLIVRQGSTHAPAVRP